MFAGKPREIVIRFGTSRTVWLRWMVGWAVIAALGVAITQTRSASGPVNPDRRSPAVVTGEGGVDLNGTRVEVVKGEIGATEVRVEINVTGRDEEGDQVGIGGIAFLVAPDGTRVPERGGENRGRRLVLSFPAEELIGSGHLQVELSGLTLGKGGRSAGGGEMVPLGKAVIGFQPNVRSGATSRTDVHAEAVAGPLRVVLDFVIQDEASAVIQGRLLGLTPAEIQAVSLRNSSLVDSLGGVSRFEGGRSGFGDGLSQFELRVDRPLRPGDIVRVTLEVLEQAGPPESSNGADALARIRSLDRVSVVLPLD